MARVSCPKLSKYRSASSNCMVGAESQEMKSFSSGTVFFSAPDHLGPRLDLRIHHEVERLDDEVAHLAAVNDGVEHAVFEEELGALEILRQLLTDGLFDDAWTGKTDQGFWLGDNQVAEHGEARGHAARRRVCQHRDEGKSRLVQLRERGGDLRHLHQAECAFLHPRAARSRKGDDRAAHLESAV